MAAEVTAIPPSALVTGGAKRIGRAIVEALAEQGFGVAIHCNRSRAEAERLAETIRGQGGRAAVVAGDLAQLADVASIVEQGAATLGPIRLLVNSASIFEDDEAAALGPERLMRHLSINLAAPCLLACAMARALPAETQGLVVNIVDQRVKKPTPQFFSYSLSKAGLAWATQTMAQALAPRIRVVGLAPGPTVKSERQSDEDFRRQAEAVPLGHGPDLAEFGRTIRWLLDTPSITGEVITLDGGQHLAWRTADVTGVNE